MSEQTKPPGWCTDELSCFIDLAQNNELATYANKRKAYAVLRKIDDIYQSLPDNLVNTKQIIPALLFLRAHSAYRASCRLSMCGEIPESFVMSRSCIEYALYAFHINLKPDAGAIWANRHNNDAARKKCRSEFLFKSVLDSLASNNSQLGKFVGDLYETLIDYGGHPNEKAVSAALQVLETDAGFNLKQLYLIGDSPALEHGLLNSARAGLCSLLILEMVWPERFAILGITNKLSNLRNILN